MVDILNPPNARFRLYTTPADYLEVAASVLGGRVRKGDDCIRLEGRISHDLDVPFALCVPKARVGIFLAVRELVEPGKQVILSPYTLSDVINMVICAGAVPVFADIDRKTCNLDPTEIKRLAGSDTAGVLVTHLHGLACDMDHISSICREKDLKLIEDAAQAFGARWHGRPVGTLGDSGIFSFGMYKILNSFFGGMLVMRDPGAGGKVRQYYDTFPWQGRGYYLNKVATGLLTDIATHPWVFKLLTFWVFRFAYLHDIGFLNRRVKVDRAPNIKYELPESYLRRLTPMQARLVLRQLNQVDVMARQRIEAARAYDEGLRDIHDLLLPPLFLDGTHVYSHYPLQTPDREALIRHMVRRGRDVAIQHLKNCADEPCFAPFHRDCPNARATAEANILMSTYPRYGLREVARNVGVIREFYGY